MNIHCLQHVSFEGLGCIEHWISKNNHRLSYTKFFEEVTFPNMNDVDFIIIMGGPMSTYDEEKKNWLIQEKLFIKKAIESGKIVLGICLGAQLIADVLGGKVYPNKEKEIGWFDVMFSPSFKTFAPNFEHNTLKVFHWHGDTFDIPLGTTNHASSKACKHQLFTYGQKVMGIQFHPEVTVHSLHSISDSDAEELKIKTTYIQSKQEIINAVEYIGASNQLMFGILDRLASQ